MAIHYLRYALYRLYRAQIVLTLVVFAVAAVFVDIAATVGLGSTGASPPSIAFALFFTGCVLWVGYWFGFRIAYWIEARPDRLAWRTAFRSGSLPIDDVRAIYSSAPLSGMGVLRTTKGRIFIFPTRYFPQFADRMGELYPAIDVRLGKLSRFSARLSGSFPSGGRWTSMMLEEGDE
jgi:hypothetical protein